MRDEVFRSPASFRLIYKDYHHAMTASVPTPQTPLPSTSALPLSVLDLSPVSSGQAPGEALRRTLELAQVADRTGYTRFWIAEHHNIPTFTSTATEILIALAAERTSRIRVGSGGVMLPNHSALKVAENFMSLEALYPGRIDLGLGRAPGSDGRTALALRRTQQPLGGDDFPVQIAMLRAFAGETPWPPQSVFSGVVAEPQGVRLPPLWILGSSLYGAQLAGELGLGYAFAYHFSQEDPVRALEVYREHFRPGALSEPYALLGVSAVVAETEEEAGRLALTQAALGLGILTGARSPLLSPEEAEKWLGEHGAHPASLLKKAVIGTPQGAYDQLRDLAARAGANEMMVTTHIHDPRARQRSYELLAQAAGLMAQPPREAGREAVVHG